VRGGPSSLLGAQRSWRSMLRTVSGCRAGWCWSGALGPGAADKPSAAAGYASCHLSFAAGRQTCGGKPRSGQDPGDQTVRDGREASGHVAYGGTVDPPRSRKDEVGPRMSKLARVPSRPWRLRLHKEPERGAPAPRAPDPWVRAATRWGDESSRAGVMPPSPALMRKGHVVGWSRPARPGVRQGHKFVPGRWVRRSKARAPRFVSSCCREPGNVSPGPQTRRILSRSAGEQRSYGLGESPMRRNGIFRAGNSWNRVSTSLS